MLKINTNKESLDIGLIYTFLSQSYWAHKRTRDEVLCSIKNSLCFGMHLNKEQIGFARVLTDKVVFSYIMDVFITPKHQGKKYGQLFLDTIYKHGDLKDVNKHYLLTKDAQQFYLKLGFKEYETPKRFMIKA